LFGERAHDIGFGYNPVFDEDSAERFARAGLLDDSRVELGLGDEAGSQQECAQRRSVGQDDFLPRNPNPGIDSLTLRLYANSGRIRVLTGVQTLPGREIQSEREIGGINLRGGR
jgi:hypothetical protein